MINQSYDTDKRFYGLYRGICMDNEDPSVMNRITLQIPQLFGSEVTNWALPCLPAGTVSSFPDVGQQVWVMFIAGDPNFPVWIGV